MRSYRAVRRGRLEARAITVQPWPSPAPTQGPASRSVVEAERSTPAAVVPRLHGEIDMCDGPELRKAITERQSGSDLRGSSST
jgi:hypothetical protein